MDLKTIQETYDRCNFSDEEKKVFPRPETEEDLKLFNNLAFNPAYGWGMGLLGLLLGTLLLPSNGLWGSNQSIEYLKEMLKKDENEKIDE